MSDRGTLLHAAGTKWRGDTFAPMMADELDAPATPASNQLCPLHLEDVWTQPATLASASHTSAIEFHVPSQIRTADYACPRRAKYASIFSFTPSTGASLNFAVVG